ncbi:MULTISPECIES: phosphoribosylamine--glycine ligase [Sphingomonas]|uniref:Phosphoribosylamine--glycine ligase n=1 Tax=Sphingomonas adhaesiva TaxID=28212 RepID=A0A2A4IBE1_9SPHN|nr:MULTISPECIES: phosphoribosylamine--glycine ligase [Sphingomonas]PCG15102.1 phosphoribosylamine--glycine ligase [Sphingomonas adhaesiva]PZU80325.1 MAG: phosphoribosylamine--glycine ligase [Sphingomonas sp.]
MNILLVGSGGREHALAWKLAQSPLLDTLFAAPGNPGIAQHATIAELDVADHRAVIDFVRRQQIGLVVVGPEGPLVDGLADNIRAIGVPVFGPGREAARLEGSKGFTKDLCARVGIPTARYFRVTSRDGALACLDDFGDTCVIKADGLAAGKGVVVADTRAQAEAAIRDLYANGPVEAVIEERLEGPEASLFVLSDGSATAVFGSAQDHKRVGDGDTGPNTGGMGAYSPALVLTPELEERALGEIVRPTIDALAAAGTPYVGVLYAGLMLTAEGPKLIEYNVRFGDPECQVLMMRFAGDLAEVLLAVAEGRLADLPAPAFADDAALTVVMAANGYPGTPEQGGAIGGITAAERDGAVAFQAGTALHGEQLVASGGRVLAVTATGADIAAAQRAAYAAVDAIDFPTGFFRRDIGAKAVDKG